MKFTCTDKLGRFPVQTLGKDFDTLIPGLEREPNAIDANLL
jgi:hypothetical protein